MIKAYLTLILLPILLLAGCKKEEKRKLPDGAILEISKDEVLQETFKEGDNRNGSIHWTDTLFELSDFGISAEEPLKSTILETGIFDFKEKGETGIAIFSTVESICDYCVPIVGIAYYTPREDFWEFSHVEYIGRVGSENGIEGIKPAQLGMGVPGFFATSQSQQNHIQTQCLVGYSYIDGEMTEVLNIRKAGENNKPYCEDSEEQCFGYEPEIEVSENEADFYDLVFTQKGNKIQADTLADVNNSYNLKFDGEKYQLPKELRDYEF